MASQSGDQELAQWLMDRLVEERQLLEMRHHSLIQDFQVQQLAQTRALNSQSENTPRKASDLKTSEIEVVLYEHEPVVDLPAEDSKLNEEAAVPENNEIRGGIGPVVRGVDEQDTQKAVKDQAAIVRTVSATEPSYGPAMSSWTSARARRKQPETPLAKLVTHSYFEFFFAILIAANMMCMAIEMQFRGARDGHDIGYRGYTDQTDMWPDVETTFQVLDWMFAIMYTIEVLLKLTALGKGFFDFWNLFDSVVVLIFYIEKLRVFHIPVDTMILRLFRLLKVLRLLRLVHEIAGFGELLLMITALKGSMHMLAWATMLLLGLQTVFAFILNQMLTELVIENDDFGDRVRRECFKYFGTFARAIFSMFELTLANWIPISRFLLEDIHEAFVLFALVYKLTLGFAVVGVVNACFIKETFKTISSDRTMMVIEKGAEKKTFQREMLKFMRHADTSSDGTLTREEFVRVCQDEHVKAWLGAQGLDAGDADKLFVLMDDGSGELEAEELVRGVGKLKGPAKSLDLCLASEDIKKIDIKKEFQQETQILERLQHIERLMKHQIASFAAYSETTL